MTKFKGLSYDDLDDFEKEELEKIVPKKASIVKKAPAKKIQRYSAFQFPTRIGIADAETGEVLVEGELAIYQSLAKIISDLEEIKRRIGKIMEE